MPLSKNLFTPLANINQPGSSFSPGEMPFPIEKQRMSNWCWAACTVSLCNFYNSDTVMTQSQFVSDVLKQAMCNSRFPNNFLCNKPYDFGTAIGFASHLHGDPIDAALEPDSILPTLKTFGPIGCQMNLPGFGTHAVLICEAIPDAGAGLFLRIADPFDGSLRIMTYTDFRYNYRMAGGRWVRTYLTN